MSTLAQNNASVPRFLFFDTCMPLPPPRRMPNIFSPLPCRLFLKVETQNLASHVQLIAISTRYNTLTNKCLPPRETQDFASLQGYATIIPSRFPLYNIAVHQSRDAKSCVSQARNAPTVSTLSLPLLAKTSS